MKNDMDKDIEMRTMDSKLLDSVRDFDATGLKKTQTAEKNNVVVMLPAQQAEKEVQTNPIKTQDQRIQTQTKPGNGLVDTFMWAIQNKNVQKAAAGLVGLYVANEIVNYVGIPLLAATAVGAGSFYAYKNIPAVKNTVDNAIRDFMPAKPKIS